MLKHITARVSLSLSSLTGCNFLLNLCLFESFLIAITCLKIKVGNVFVWKDRCDYDVCVCVYCVCVHARQCDPNLKIFLGLPKSSLLEIV